MKHLVVILGFLCGALAFSGMSCRQEPKNGTQPDPLAKKLERYYAQTDTSWSRMMASDDAKISNLKRLADELLLIDGSNEKNLQGLRKKADSLSAIRYDRQNLRENGKIDAYDMATNEVIAGLRKEIAENPNAIKYQIVNQLVSEIIQADDSVLILRKEYDRSLDSVRLFKKSNKRGLKKVVPSLDSLPDYPYFRLLPP